MAGLLRGCVFATALYWIIDQTGEVAQVGRVMSINGTSDAASLTGAGGLKPYGRMPCVVHELGFVSLRMENGNRNAVKSQGSIR